MRERYREQYYDMLEAAEKAIDKWEDAESPILVTVAAQDITPALSAVARELTTTRDDAITLCKALIAARDYATELQMIIYRKEQE